MKVKEILGQWLKDNGYDGLYNEDCGCEIDDLAPCCIDCIAECEAGYKVPCPGPEDCSADGDCYWHISGTKPGDKKVRGIE